MKGMRRPSTEAIRGLIAAIEIHLERGDGVEAGIALLFLAEQCASVEVSRHPTLADTAVALCATFVDRFGRAPDPAMRRLVSRVLAKRGWLLATPDRYGEISSNSDRMIELFEGDPDPIIRQRVAFARLNRLISS